MKILKESVIKILSLLFRLIPLKLRIHLLFQQRMTGWLDYKQPLKMVISSETGYRRLFSCQKEPGTVSWLEENIKSGDVIYDIGANTGAYSLISAIIKEKVNVIAFEPVPGNFMELCENILLNNLSDIITPVYIPLSDQDSVKDFGLRDMSPGSAMHVGISNTSSIVNSGRSIFNYKVATRSLDNLINDFGIPLPNIMKIDVDGPELEILKGSCKTLSYIGLRTIQVEVDGNSPTTLEIQNLLQNFKFAVSKKTQHGSSDIYDYIFTRKDRAE